MSSRSSRRGSGKDLNPRSRANFSIAAVVSTNIAYTATLYIFYPVFGEPLTILSVVPIMVTAWLFGPWAGMGQALFVPALHVAIHQFLDPLAPGLLADPGFIVGSMAGIVVGAVVGQFSNLGRRLRHELSASNTLRVERNRLAMILEDSHDAIVVRDMSGRIIVWNDGAEHAYGYSKEEGVQLVAEDLAPEHHAAYEQSYIDAVFEEGTVESFEIRRLTKDGRIVDVWVTATVLRDEDGSPLGVATTERDITKRNQRETEAARRSEELELANENLTAAMQAKDQFLASVSHELRTPLTSVLGFLSVLSDGGADLTATEPNEMLALANLEANDLADIVEDLLVGARVDFSELTFARVPVTLAAQAAQVVEARTAFKDVVIRKAPLVKAEGDPERVRQILRNLLTNATRYGGSRIWIDVRRKDESASISVCDDGTGIKHEDRQRIFEPYDRGSQNQVMPGSLGLGLSVSQKLAKAMEGELTYRYEDSISVFTLSLPLRSVTKSKPRRHYRRGPVPRERVERPWQARQ